MRVYTFGPYRFYSRGLLLLRDAVELPLPRRAGQLLRALLDHEGAPLTNQELLDAAWGANVSVEEANVSQQVHVIRTTLGPRPAGGHYVENLRGRGYRFVGLDSVEDEDARPSVPPHLETAGLDPGPPATPPHRSHWWAAPGTWLLVGVAIIALLAAGAPGRHWGDNEVPELRLGPPRSLTRDGTYKVTSPLLADASRVVYNVGSRESPTVLPLPGGEPQPIFQPPARFMVEDLHATRQEFLARQLPAPDGAVDLPLWIIPVAAGPLRRVGDVKAHYASWSPDGKEVAVVRDGVLQVVGADGAASRELPTPPGTVAHWPRWSPDGAVIRFTAASVHPHEGYHETIWEVDVNGRGLRPLPFSGDAGRAECCGVWTPDGSWFVYQSRYGGKTELRAMNAEEARPVTLTRGEASFGGPAVSPDGQTLYALGWPAHGELVSLDTSRGAYVIEPTAVSGTWVTYSPIGDAIAYVSHPDKKLWRARPDGSAKRQLVSGPFEVDACAWSPDNRWIAFLSRMGGSAFRIHLIPPDGGTPRSISDTDRAQGVPSWSPDGRKLVFGDVPGQFGNPDGVERLWIHDVEARTTHAIDGTETLGVYSPRWSPDGSRLAAVEIARPRRIRVYEFRTKTWRVLHSTSHVDSAQWTRDGRALIYKTEGNVPGLKRVDIAADRVTDLADLRTFTFAPDAYGWHGLTPDDRPMLLRSRGGTEVYAFPILR
jgi:Tol biopolymer transport system component/DNA-binding winged helix-turn-helix (wHTH) protein